jgi:hypothetical protein
MRKNFITNDYKNHPKSGVVNMKEVPNFMGSKNMFIEESFIIKDTYINDYISNPLKSNKQSTTETLTNPTWEFKLKPVELLSKYLYEQISLNSNDFQNINKNNTQNGNLDDTIKFYINNNIIGLYKLNNIYMWTEYNNLILNTVSKNSIDYVLLKNKPIFNQSIKPLIEPYKHSEKLNIIQQNKFENLISYKQLQDAENYMYFYNFEFEFIRI